MKKAKTIIISIALTVLTALLFILPTFAETTTACDASALGFQMRNDGSTDIRLVGEVANAEFYREVGFFLHNGEKEVKFSATCLFKTLLAADADGNTYTAVTAEGENYLFALTISGIPDAAVTLTVTPYTVSLDGVTVRGESKRLAKEAGGKFAPVAISETTVRIAEKTYGNGEAKYEYAAGEKLLPTDNFFYHISYKDANMTKSASLRMNIALECWTTDYAQCGFYVKADGSKVQLIHEVYGKWNVDASYTLSDEEIAKIGGEGLDLFILHRASAPNRLEVFMDNGESGVKQVMTYTIANLSNIYTQRMAYQSGSLNFTGKVTVYDFTGDAEGLMAELLPLRHVARVEADCTTDGNIEYWTDGTKYYADVNGTVELTADEIVIKAPGHSYDTDKYEYDIGSHWNLCKTCGAESEHIAHTRNENGVCSVCGAQVLGDLHKVEAVAPSCTTAGNTEYWTDGVYYFKDEAHTEPTTLAEVTLPMLNHSYAWVNTDANQHWKACVTCGDVDESTRAAHTFSDGVCTICDATEPNGSTVKISEKTYGNGEAKYNYAAGEKLLSSEDFLYRITYKDANMTKSASLRMDIALECWTTAYAQCGFYIKADGSKVQLIHEVYGKWNVDASYTLSDEEIAKINGEGLNFFVLHRASAPDRFEIWTEDGNGGVKQVMTYSVGNLANIYAQRMVYQSGSLTFEAKITVYLYTGKAEEVMKGLL